MTTEAGIRVRGIEKSFTDVQVLRGVDFDVAMSLIGNPPILFPAPRRGPGSVVGILIVAYAFAIVIHRRTFR